MITIYDIAKQAGISAATVSKVFNEYPDVSAKTRKKVLDTAREMGYLPNLSARTLITGRSWTLGILYMESSGKGIRHPFFNALMESFKNEAESRGYDLMFISRDIGGRKTSYLEHCRFRSVDGVMAALLNPGDPDVQELLKSGIPCVLVDYEAPLAGMVQSDNVGGAMLAVRHLYSMGHRRIAHISGGWSFAGVKRRQGYEQALQELGLPLREEDVADSGGDYTEENGYRAMQRLLEQEERPTAVFAAGDNLAIGAIKALRERGLSVPEDMSIVGFDDIDLAAYMSPSLTTVRQDTAALGAGAARMLAELISQQGSAAAGVDGPKEMPALTVPVELVVRDSCRRL